MTIKKPREQAITITLNELKSMIPAFLVCNGIVLIICVIYCIAVAFFDWRLLTGLLLGNIAAVLNFYHLGARAGNVMRRKDAAHARRYSAFSFLGRYVGAFIAFGVLIRFDIINPVTVVIPLFYPKIHYTVKSIFNKEI